MHVLFSRGVSPNQVSFSERRFTHTRVDLSNVCLLPCRQIEWENYDDERFFFL